MGGGFAAYFGGVSGLCFAIFVHELEILGSTGCWITGRVLDSIGLCSSAGYRFPRFVGSD